MAAMEGWPCPVRFMPQLRTGTTERTLRVRRSRPVKLQYSSQGDGVRARESQTAQPWEQLAGSTVGRWRELLAVSTIGRPVVGEILAAMKRG